MQHFNGKEHDPGEVLHRIHVWMLANSNLPLPRSRDIDDLELSLIFSFCYLAYKGKGMDSGATGAASRSFWWSQDLGEYRTHDVLPYYVMYVDMEIVNNNDHMLGLLRHFQAAVQLTHWSQRFEAEPYAERDFADAIARVLGLTSRDKKIEPSPTW